MPAGSGRYPSGQRGQTVNLLANAFGGSNPPLPTTSWPRREKRGNSSAVERQPSKLGVAGSNPVSRSSFQYEPQFGPSDVGGPPKASREIRDGAGAPVRTGPFDRRVERRRLGDRAHVAQVAERVLGKDEVSGSIPDMGSTFFGG